MEWTNVVAGDLAEPEQINLIGNQAANFKGLRLAKQVILTGTAATIEIDTDSDGNPLNSTLGGVLIVHSGTNTSIATTATYYAQFNGITGTDYWYTLASPSSSALAGVAGSLFSNSRIFLDIVNQNIIVTSNYAVRYSTGGSAGILGSGLITPQTSITAIKLFFSSGTFPADTVVQWWERG